MAGTLIIHAPNVYMGLIGKFNIIIDGKQISAIKAGKTTEFTIHKDCELQVRIASNMISSPFPIPANKITELEFTVHKFTQKCTPQIIRQEECAADTEPQTNELEEMKKKGGYKLTAREMQLMALNAGCSESTAMNGAAGFNHIADSVRPDEKVVFCIATGPIYARQHSLGNSAVVLTDSRLIFAGGTSDFIKTVSSFSLDLSRIDAIDMQAQMLVYNLMITASGEQTKCTFAAMKDENGARLLKEFINAVYDCKQTKSEVKPQTNIINQVSAADELKKFKELLDMGVLTQEEFDAKKKQLLGL